MERMLKERGITLIAIIVTIIVLLILAGTSFVMLTGEDGILTNTKEAKEQTNKKTATEKINLKITDSQIKTYTKEKRMPTLQEVADHFCEDDEIQYVRTLREVASIDKITVGEATSIFTKLKEYPYKFEINSLLQLESIDDVKIGATETVPKEQYDELVNEIGLLRNRITALENKTTMKKVNSGIKSSTLVSSKWSDIHTFVVPEDCYAHILGCVGFTQGDNSTEYTGVQLFKNNELLNISGKGGKGTDVQEEVSYTGELKKGDKIVLQAEQLTGRTINILYIFDVNYFPISK